LAEKEGKFAPGGKILQSQKSSSTKKVGLEKVGPKKLCGKNMAEKDGWKQSWAEKPGPYRLNLLGYKKFQN
jgi:hypothetical protein